MTKYFFQGIYVGDGIKGLLREGGSKRRDAVVEALKSVGGSLDCIYYAFGEVDVLGVMDIPDQASAAALSLMINSTGAVSVHLIPLMTPEDIDAATDQDAVVPGARGVARRNDNSPREGTPRGCGFDTRPRFARALLNQRW